MKKFLCAALLASMMLCSSVSAAGVGSAFSSEEIIGESVINGMVGRGSYASVVANFVPDMAQKFTEAAHKQGIASVQKDFGNISNIRLVSANRAYNPQGQFAFDTLIFLANGSNGKNVGVEMMFVPQGGSYKVAAVGFRPVELRAPQQK